MFFLYAVLYCVRMLVVTFIAIFLWATTLYYVPQVVLWIAGGAEVLEKPLIGLLAQISPALAALLVSTPVTPNLVFLVFFIPALTIVQVVIQVFKRK